jgi:AcrR family transcriptional regulator
MSRRDELLGAARTIFAERGDHETTVEEITRAAGVAKGTFYLYFSEKREIFLAIIRELLDAIKAIGASVADLVVPGEHPVAFLERAEHAAVRLMEVFRENHAVARLVVRESMGMDPVLESMIRDFYRETAEIEAHNIVVAQRLGLLRDCDPLLTAFAHIGMVERVVLTMLESPELFPEPRVVIRQMMRLAYEGLRAEGAPSPFTEPATSEPSPSPRETSPARDP